MGELSERTVGTRDEFRSLMTTWGGRRSRAPHRECGGEEETHTHMAFNEFMLSNYFSLCQPNC